MKLGELDVLLVLLVLLGGNDAGQPFYTEIQPEPDYMDRAVIILPEEKNANITIQCVSIQCGVPAHTAWYVLLPGAPMVVSDLLLSSQFSRSGPNESYLTIFNINQDLDRAEIACGAGITQFFIRFLLGFEATAQLVSAGEMSVRVGDSVSLSLEADGNSPFSPLVTFQWMHNDTDLNSSERISLDNYSISITGVQREDAGDFRLLVSNSAGSGVGNFTLDVQFGPDAIDVSVSPLYFIAGTDVTLITFVNIEGNPEPSSNWTLNSNPLSDVRFDTSVAGKLSITNISSADEGAYICTLTNGDSAFDKSATIELFEAVFPSMPENIIASEVNSTSARLTWDAPSTPGTFGVSFYCIRVVAFLSNEVIQTSKTEVLLTGLLPGNEYTVTVTAVVNNINLLSQGVVEIESLPALFTTPISAIPMVTTASATLHPTSTSTCMPGDSSLVVGLSVALTFLVTAIVSSLVAVLVTTSLCSCGKKSKRTPLDPAHLYDTPSSAGGGKEVLNMSPNLAYGPVQPQSTVEIGGGSYDNMNF